MSKYLLGAILAVAVIATAGFIAPTSVQAQTTDVDLLVSLLGLTPQQAATLAQLLGTTGGNTGTTAAGACSFSSSLTEGSQGAQVTCLQQYLEAGGYLQMPTGTAYGYFGPLTKSAVAAWQSANGVAPAYGYFGPISIAKYNMLAASAPGGGGSGVTYPAGCTSFSGYSSTTGQPCSGGGMTYPAGCTSSAGFSTTTGMPCSGGVSLPTGCTSTAGYSPTTGAKCDGTTTGGGTVGQEGILTATIHPTPASGTTVREGDVDTAILGIELEARNSDIAVQRVRLNLGTSATMINRYLSRLALYDGSTLLTEVNLPGGAVKSGNDWVVDLVGFSSIVPTGTKKVLTVKADAYNTIDTSYAVGGANYPTTANRTVAVATDGIRGVDGAGINQTTGSTAISRVLAFNKTVTDSASLVVSTSISTPKAAPVTASQGTGDDEYDGMELLAFNLKAEKDAVEVTDLIVSITRGGNTSTATATTAYLYDGNTLVGSASVVGTSASAMTATFSDIDYVVPKDTTRTLMLKLDIRSAGAAVTTFSATITGSSGITAERSNGDSLVASGSAGSETMSVRNSGLEVALVSKSLDTSTVSGTSGATTTAQAHFTVRLTAVGADVYLGSNATTSANRTFNPLSFGIYLNSALTTVVSATSTDFTFPSSGITTTGLDEIGLLSEGNSVVFDVYHIIPGRTAAGVKITDGNYSVGLRGVTWSLDNETFTTSDFMAGDTAWRTNSKFISH